MDIIEKDLNDLVPYENNPRMNEDAVEMVAESIKAFGFKVPIVIDKDNVIVAGHTRALAAKSLKMERVPCIVASDLTPAQIKAFRLADNKVSDYSLWDNKKLLIELETIEGGLFTGFEKSDFFDDVENMGDVSPLDESDNSVVADNECGVEYKLVFRTRDKELIDDIRKFVEGRTGIG